MTTPTDQQIFVCPTSKVPYCGMCPVTNCNLNITALGRMSGCLVNFLHGKKQITEADLAFVYNIPMKEVAKRIADGHLAMKKVLILYQILLRQPTSKSQCDLCGIYMTTGHDKCANVLKCEARQKLKESFAKTHPLMRIVDLGLNMASLFLLISRRKAINKYLATFDSENFKIRIRGLLRLTRKQFEAIKELLPQPTPAT